MNIVYVALCPSYFIKTCSKNTKKRDLVFYIVVYSVTHKRVGATGHNPTTETRSLVKLSELHR